jgi:hypothetical protein
LERDVRPDALFLRKHLTIQLFFHVRPHLIWGGWENRGRRESKARKPASDAAARDRQHTNRSHPDGGAQRLGEDFAKFPSRDRDRHAFSSFVDGRTALPDPV